VRALYSYQNFSTTSRARKSKKIYAVLWVDDAGSAPLTERFIKWYHENAGPISFGIEIDDRYPWSFDKLLRATFVDPTFDHLSHHHHPICWKGKSLIKWIYDSTELYWNLYTFFRLFGFSRLPSVLLRSGVVGIGLIFLALAYFLYPYNVMFSILFLTILSISAIMTFTWFNVRSSHNWKTAFLDIGWNEKFLYGVKEKFEDRGFEYPAVIRHGWNIPLPHMMKFYIKNLGVIADCSPTPTEEERDVRIDDVMILWKNLSPYYASLNHGYEVEWDEKDEEDRGLLMLPVTLGNIAVYGFGEEKKKLIEQVPEGGLVSACIHPVDDSKTVVNWVKYLKTNFDVEFITAEEYARVFMRKKPRPILIDKTFKSYWAFKEGSNFYPIREVVQDTVSLQIIKHSHSFTEFKLTIATESPVPEIFVEGIEVEPLVDLLCIEQRGDGVILKMVRPGVYLLKARASPKFMKV